MFPVKLVDAIAKERFGITVTADGGWTTQEVLRSLGTTPPAEWVEWWAEKYDLRPL